MQLIISMLYYQIQLLYQWELIVDFISLMIIIIYNNDNYKCKYQ